VVFVVVVDFCLFVLTVWNKDGPLGVMFSSPDGGHKVREEISFSMSMHE
jgi:hypothetical protein